MSLRDDLIDCALIWRMRQNERRVAPEGEEKVKAKSVEFHAQRQLENKIDLYTYVLGQQLKKEKER